MNLKWSPEAAAFQANRKRTLRTQVIQASPSIQLTSLNKSNVSKHRLKEAEPCICCRSFISQIHFWDYKYRKHCRLLYELSVSLPDCLSTCAILNEEGVRGWWLMRVASNRVARNGGCHMTFTWLCWVMMGAGSNGRLRPPWGVFLSTSQPYLVYF